MPAIAAASNINTLKGQLSRFLWTLERTREPLDRGLRGVRNLFIDPPPRSDELRYEGFTLAYPTIFINYRLRNRTYTHRVVLVDCSVEQFNSLEAPGWSSLLNHIGLSFAPFHLRVTDFATVRATTAPLSQDMQQFHEAALLGGSAEFRYRSGLNPARHVAYHSEIDSEPPAPLQPALTDKVLVLNGGGKDSIVAAELVRSIGLPFAWFSVRTNAVREAVVASSGIDEFFRAEYHLDPALIADARYASSPMSMGLLSSLALIPAALNGYRYIAIASEFSSNFATREFRGMQINHQYGKSFAFESLLADLMNRRLVQGIEYFSVIRPFYEIRLAAMFSRLDEYLDSFVSCNKGIGRASWCRDCPKCAFIFLILYPFLDDLQLKRVFGENLFNRRRIRCFMMDAATAGRKPWECVGTPEETQLALRLSLNKSPELEFKEWPYRRDLERACTSLDVPTASKHFLQELHGPHRLPERFASRIAPVADSWS